MASNIKHALLSASGSPRWLACPPSSRLEEHIPRKQSTYADEGTAAHELCELEARVTIGEITKQAYKKALKLFKSENVRYYDAEMQEFAEQYAEFIKETFDEKRAEVSDSLVALEVSLDFSEWVPEGFGTADCIIVSDGEMEIIDAKYGKGVRVDAHNNSQMQLYALGAYTKYCTLYDIKNIKMSIFQARINREPSTDVISVDELLDWAEKTVAPQAALAFAGEGEFGPSAKACQWCRAKEQCHARADKILELFDDIDEASAPDVLIAPTEAGAFLARAKDLNVVGWLDDLKSLIEASLWQGQPVEGWKLVEGRSRRVIPNETEAAKRLIEAGYKASEIFAKKLLSITKLEAQIGKKMLAEILGDSITKPPGSPTVVQASDKRTEFSPEGAILATFDEE